MRIEVRSRNIEVTDELRDRVHKRFSRLSRQVSGLATLEVELSEERNPSNPNGQVAEATLRLKGVTLRAREASPDLVQSIKALSKDLQRQVKRHREMRRKRSQTRRMVGRLRGGTA